MKKINLIALALTITYPFMTLNAQSNFYLGAGVGASFDTYDLNASNLITSYTLITSADKTNVIGNIFAGGGYTLENNVFLGGEIGTRFPSRAVTLMGLSGISSSYPLYNNTFSVSDYATLDILPGYSIDPNILVYGRAGLSYSSLTLKQPIAGSRHDLNINDNSWGGRIGLGAHITLINNFSLGTDYYYSFYQTMNIYSPVFNTHLTPKISSHFLGLSVLYSI